ncbi:hypothetical protein KEM56_007840 [Ascosphaera pollenicola]|nr:hypothetical protein KEM56_007840 [Ascosphaera pollenicola]
MGSAMTENAPAGEVLQRNSKIVDGGNDFEAAQNGTEKIEGNVSRLGERRSLPSKKVETIVRTGMQKSSPHHRRMDCGERSKILMQDITTTTIKQKEKSEQKCLNPSLDIREYWRLQRKGQIWRPSRGKD